VSKKGIIYAGNVGANNHTHRQTKLREEYLHNYVDSRTVQN